MSTEIGANVTLLARAPSEMETVQNKLVQWAGSKIEAVRLEMAEADENYEIARKNKWRSSPFKSQVTKARCKISFYEKIQLALKAGYYIVPPFPIDLFAIRTDRVYPNRKHSTSVWTTRTQTAKRLPVGDGRYVAPEPTVFGDECQTENRKGEEVTETDWSARNFQNVDFPFKLVKPAILEQVGRAMKDKLFDQLGALPAFAKADPMVVGQILHWNPNRPPVTFFISWWLDTADL